MHNFWLVPHKSFLAVRPLPSVYIACGFLQLLTATGHESSARDITPYRLRVQPAVRLTPHTCPCSPSFFLSYVRRMKELNFSHQKRLNFSSAVIKTPLPLFLSNSNRCPKAINHQMPSLRNLEFLLPAIFHRRVPVINTSSCHNQTPQKRVVERNYFFLPRLHL